MAKMHAMYHTDPYDTAPVLNKSVGAFENVELSFMRLQPKSTFFVEGFLPIPNNGIER